MAAGAGAAARFEGQRRAHPPYGGREVGLGFDQPMGVLPSGWVSGIAQGAVARCARRSFV